ncbi:MAG: glycosyl hydrolase, partial [Cytophagaceae bacterium]
RKYVLAHDPDRLLAPFLREAGLDPKKESYPNWESMGLDGHTAGHYLSALADMIASGDDADGEMGRRLDYMLSELDRAQKANGNGYLGGLPGSRDFWPLIAAGDTGKIWSKWAPWYNLHKMFAGLRDSAIVAKKPKARELLIKFGDWCVNTTSGLTDAQMQGMLSNEYGGMNEVMADIYAITGDKKYLDTAERFNHRSFFEPLMRGQDKLTGLHANTQIPKIIGLERIATLTGNAQQDLAAHFFWNTVVRNRTTAFGGNSVSEHFNDPSDFHPMLESREGPETCNTYNMLRLTEQLFATKPLASYADYYERALYNHILSAIDPQNPGYVYFTPIRPDHYRVYSEPEQSFWCCVGTGMENPGRYGQFIYARDKEGLYVNLFIPSELQTPDGVSLRQENTFPSKQSTHFSLKLPKPSTFALRIRHPQWVPEGKLSVRVNGIPIPLSSKPSSYATVRRQWRSGDKIDVGLPMHIAVEQLPDKSNWAAILYG